MAYHYRVATLHQERISRGTPAAWLLLTHGIYGAGSNWRGIARKLVERRPDWGVILVDLRQHGRSEPGEPPHTLAAAAEDLRPLLPEVAATAGHSFGGKVVLAARAFAPPTLRQTWMFDSSPSARTPEDSSVMRVLELMERLPRTWARREDFVAAVTAEGHSLALAQWLAMNVVPDARGALHLRLDLAAIRSLLDSYFQTDLWDVAFDPALPGTLEVVIAERSGTLSAADRARLAAAPPHVHANVVDADHWLHIEAPGAVVDLLANRLA
jgi:pimeloyl-ACP methyl ester carboxylesterase